MYVISHLVINRVCHVFFTWYRIRKRSDPEPMGAHKVSFPSPLTPHFTSPGGEHDKVDNTTHH